MGKLNFREHICIVGKTGSGKLRVIEYLEERGDIGKEIMLLLDDIAFRAQFDTKVAEVLVELYATLRLRNISVVSTLQLHNPNFCDLMSNSGYVIVMNALNQRKILGNILRYYIQERQVPELVDEVCARFGGDSCGDYIAICLTPRANENKIYTIVRDIFDPSDGLRRGGIRNVICIFEYIYVEYIQCFFSFIIATSLCGCVVFHFVVLYGELVL